MIRKSVNSDLIEVATVIHCDREKHEYQATRTHRTCPSLCLAGNKSVCKTFTIKISKDAEKLGLPVYPSSLVDNHFALHCNCRRLRLSKNRKTQKQIISYQSL